MAGRAIMGGVIVVAGATKKVGVRVLLRRFRSVRVQEKTF